MSDDEMLLMLRRWYQMRWEAYAISEGQERATTEEKLALKRWLEVYGLKAVNDAMWDVILKGRKVEGYHPRFSHVGKLLQRDYEPIKRRSYED